MVDLWQPYAGCATDALQTEIPERWLRAVDGDPTGKD
jgi:hypothetical protein